MDVITKPGFYRQRNGGKAEVFAERDGLWYGLAPHVTSQGCMPSRWTSSGEQGGPHDGCRSEYDVLSVWHEPPTPPEGFVVMPKDYVARAGDMVRLGSWEFWKRVEDSYGWEGNNCRDLDEKLFSSSAPHYIASPIPKPAKPDPGQGWRPLEEGERTENGDEVFEYGRWVGRMFTGDRITAQHQPHRRRLPKPFRISDHGCGVYETRDGREATVSDDLGADRTYRWRGLSPSKAFITWDDEGRWDLIGQTENDLVRYLRPLPKQETPEPQWTRTNEWRDRLFHMSRGASRPEGLEQRIVNNEWRFVVREQRWTNGTDSEWRPVPVTND